MEVAFTDRDGGVSAGTFSSLNLAAVGLDDRQHVKQNLALVMEAFAGSADASVALMHQVHGNQVAVVGRGPDADVVPGPVTVEVDDLARVDGLVTAEPDVTLVVRVADCVPLLLAAGDGTGVAALHVGRAGLVGGIVAAGLEAMTSAGATGGLTAWVGPSVCGSCYEVPAELREEVCRTVPEAWAETSWGTPSVDVAAGIRAQLTRGGGVAIVDASRCTREHEDLFSYRRDGERAGRMAGLVRIRG